MILPITFDVQVFKLNSVRDHSNFEYVDPPYQSKCVHTN